MPFAFINALLVPVLVLMLVLVLVLVLVPVLVLALVLGRESRTPRWEARRRHQHRSGTITEVERSCGAESSSPAGRAGDERKRMMSASSEHRMSTVSPS
ncbi:hypothetical protein AB0I49_11300 [Streptomyces sp. NPDC050617]|uniref:hypothetical protein n=1 Tax=Streptomyces sp. NPDC050617 TaxID=3154628 RepID=UPI003428B66C